MPTASLFTSGVQKELQEEQRAVKALVEEDSLHCSHFRAFPLPTKLS